MGNQTVAAKTGANTSVKDSLDHVRASAQELHGAISDAVAKRGGATKAELEALQQKIKTVTESAKTSMSTQRDAAKKHIGEAVTQLETTQKHLTDGLKTSGQAFQTSILNHQNAAAARRRDGRRKAGHLVRRRRLRDIPGRRIGLRS
jgi:ElaB/YqjD/DUF883 family membrane-anchored ribosome-binding protein